MKGIRHFLRDRIGRQRTPAVADRGHERSTALDQERDRAGAVHPGGIVRLGQPPVFKRERYRVMNGASDGSLPMRTEVVVSADGTTIAYRTVGKGPAVLVV